ncbi:MAG: methylglyoxal synthase [Phormidesmis sp. RL_2_1]|nr:methylglyoxal synthase [Phormidesmis sp. RL_2_1]
MPTTVALIAHDSQKNALVNFVNEYAKLLSRYQLIATATTGDRILQAIAPDSSLTLKKCLPGAMGGDIQIAALVAENQIAAVIFLTDSLSTNHCTADVNTMLRMCQLHNVPLATNLATARAVVLSLAKSRIAHLIFNPVSGQGNPNQDLKLIRQILEPQIQVNVICTEVGISPGEQAREAIAAGTDLILASGGDGTVSAVAEAIMQTDTPLGVIPRGTANAFSVALGIPTNLRAACETILAGTTKQVDVATCNGAPMVLLAGIGFEAETVERANREMKNRLGILAYILAGMQQLADQEVFEADIDINGQVNKFQCVAITVANAAPPTSVMAQGFGEVLADDGLLDVTIGLTPLEAQGLGARLQGMGAIADLLTAALVKRPAQNEDILSLRVPAIKVTTHPPQKVVVDGEIVGTTPVAFQCISKGLTILAPIATE